MTSPLALGASLYVPATRPDLAAVAGGTKYPALRSVVVCTEDGVRIGKVTDAVHHPAADCVVVATERGQIEIPIHEPYVVEVDLRDGILRVAHTADFEPEGGS